MVDVEKLRELDRRYTELQKTDLKILKGCDTCSDEEFTDKIRRSAAISGEINKARYAIFQAIASIDLDELQNMSVEVLDQILPLIITYHSPFQDFYINRLVDKYMNTERKMKK